MTDVRLQAALERAAQMRQVTDRPQQRRGSSEGVTAFARGTLLSAEVRAKGDTSSTVVVGYASVTESPYDMYDFYGPYTEVVSRGSFEKTLSAAPLVEFTVNHGAGGGLPMAHTRNSTLTLSEDETGLRYEATVDPTRSDVADMLKALERGDLAEASFKFRIDSGQWSPDYSEFRINAVDLANGDVSAVNFGANPAASSGLRAGDPLPIEQRADLRLQRLALAILDD